VFADNSLSRHAPTAEPTGGPVVRDDAGPMEMTAITLLVAAI